MTQITTTEVIEWASRFLAKAEEELSPDEVKEQKKYASLIQTAKYKTFLSQMLDQSSQIRDNGILNKQVKKIIEEYGIPDFFNSVDRCLFQLYLLCGHWFPFLAIPIFKKKLRNETKKIIIPEERPQLTQHLKNRWEHQIGQNVNLLGEVVLGDKEAYHRYQHYLEALKEPDINYISIKLSGIYAQIHSLSYEQNKKELCQLVASIYRQAIRYPYVDAQGISQAKFVNLDMEEYKDAELTLDVFMEVMNEPEFKQYTAGVVIQAYLPDASGFQQRLLQFAKKRYAEGGAPLKMRLVKGANLQMESIISSLKGWPNPVYPTKVEVDANYLHILDIALQAENARALHVGVASHNFFTIAYAYLLAEKNKVEEYVSFEMLEGMANNLPRVMRKMQKQIILYTPVVKAKHFLNAVSYLVRRLDENTGKDNFLSYSFNLKLNSPQWQFLSNQFSEAYALKDHVRTQPFRTQDRNLPPAPAEEIHTFVNEPDTDLDLPQNRQWALNILKKWEARAKEPASWRRIERLSFEQVKEAIATAEKDASGWRKTSLEERNRILRRVAENLSIRRGDLIGCMSAVTGKTFTEGDIEVSEAIDFCRYYPISLQTFEQLDTVSYAPKGIILVIPPWNFPLAIPVGGVVAALAGGNTVILKPASVAEPIAWQFAQCFWEAGIPKDALQIVNPAERSSLQYLTSHPSIRHIILTGGTDTAFRLLESSPRTPLAAETGGKNAIILTGCGDQDHAILNAVSSAFSNAGQKCSACSLLLVDKRTYCDPTFQSKLKDAVTSLRTGSVWDPMNSIGPMVDNRNEKLLHAIEHLEEGESWLVAPEFVDQEKYILKPSVKWGVKPGSYTFQTELFAPLLSVVCIDHLEQGVEYANSSEYGLTAGLQSLDRAEQTYWKERIEAGNLYINRGITGAIVGRQPFGGMKRSAFGGGIKAGSPNYVSCFVDFTEKDLPDGKRLETARENYQKIWNDEFSQEKDIHPLYGEENIFRYLPLKSMGFRVQEADSLDDVLLVLLAAQTSQIPLTVSISANDSKQKEIENAVSKAKKITLRQQNEAEFIEEMERYERIRTCSPCLSDSIYQKAAKLGKHIAYAKPLREGRIELLHYLKEQSVAYECHRYGSIFGEEKREA
ncbi:MAG: bifunctional proline dehydrogenase/L-glutamate gamma-semialdehyde dehydrogenase [Candidatus Azobacteroides sp.]|nr:bifunctional proline dehydrogenase/L-glutamate gamma-semialdehyde dehydrogenase [Candidatus Azobacteroides sp.]